jgi:hypothetical protein
VPFPGERAAQIGTDGEAAVQAGEAQQLRDREVGDGHSLAVLDMVSALVSAARACLAATVVLSGDRRLAVPRIGDRGLALIAAAAVQAGGNRPVHAGRPAAQLRLGRVLCESLTEPGDCQARFSLGGGGREVPRSVAVERLRVRARWAKSRRIRPGSACLCRYRRSIPGGTRND